MPQTACPYCGANLYPHELTNGECTSCMRRLPERFQSEADWERPARPVPEPAFRRDGPDGDYERRPASGYRLLRTGVNWVRWGVGLNLVLEVLGDIVLFAVTNAGPRGRGEAAVYLLIGLGLLRIGVFLVGFVGVCFCCAVPRESEGAGWARGLIACLTLTVCLGLAAVAIPVLAAERGGRQEELFMMFVLDLIGLAFVVFGGSLCFFMTLRGAARDFGALELGGGFLAYFITSLVVSFGVFGGAVALIGVLNASHGILGGHGEALAVALVLGFLALAAGLALVVWLLTLLSRLSNLLSGPPPGRRFPDGGRWD